VILVVEDILAFLLGVLRRARGGRALLETGRSKVASLSFGPRELEIDLVDLEPIKAARELLKIPGREGKSPLSGLSRLKKTADMLKREGYTVSIRWRGRPVVVLGERARPGIAREFLGTDSIGIKSMKDAIELASQLA